MDSPGFEFWSGQEIFFSPTTPRPALEPTPDSCSVGTEVVPGGKAAGT